MKLQLWQVFRLLYRYPAFGRLWIGRLVSLFGDAFALIALPWFVLQVTGSGTATAGILLTLQLPTILTSMVIGSLIDRFQPRAMMAIDNGLRTLIISLIPILYWFGLLELWLLFLLTFLAGMLEPATEIGSRTTLPHLVEDKDLDAANMLWSFSLNLSLVVGPAVAGVLVASFGGPSVLLIDAGTFAVMAFIAITLPILKRSKPPAQTALSERLGLRQLWDMKIVRFTTLLSLVFFFSYGPLEAALPIYSEAILQTDARGYGLLWSALAVGALIGTLSSTALSKRLRLGVALPTIALLWKQSFSQGFYQ
jgi:MFS family permease